VPAKRKQIFTTPLTDYDFLIRLKRGESEVRTVFKNLRGNTWKDVYIDFDPLRDFLRDLEVSLTQTLLTSGLFRRCYLMVLR
jgi:hypothetical protein